MGEIYTLHFSERIGREGRNGALHYVGWAVDAHARLADHLAGTGASITRWAAQHGIGMTIVDIRPGTRSDERRLKRNGHHDARCGICQAAS